MSRFAPVTTCSTLLLVCVTVSAAAPDWQSGTTGKGTARWTAKGERMIYRGADFGWAVTGEPIRDGFVEVRFRPFKGLRDQAGGIVWRWQDANNYYVARANALENNVVAYKMVDGRRTDLKPIGAVADAYGVRAQVTRHEWHTIRADFTGSEFVIRFERVLVTFTVRDQTFTGPGRVGIWSKADSETEFEDFRAGSR